MTATQVRNWGHSPVLTFKYVDVPDYSQEVLLEEQGTKVAVRTECVGVCGKVFKAIGVAVPPTIRIVGK